ncbi:MFS transporter, partial [Blochmannia endosymbiont of Polyrhachis (Hedomyrma) turneri]|uniref:MFS transporter n=1 Tax=Blochmannia endosymbiont of Polyrhachis (Hedomyrma) turneri TaxID=1505596 RepID=UPI00061A6A0A
MTYKEIYIVFILNIIFSLRMLGIFMTLPVISTYGMKLTGSSELLIGIAIGIYGLTQIIFQIPFGFASDKIGRKPVIITGLLISSMGTCIAAIIENIWGLILGRALQGVSAISATILALLSDLIQNKNKTKAMMFFGLNFAITFAISIILGPIITNSIGLQGLFLTITLLTLLGIVLIIFFIPSLSQQNIKNSNHQYITINSKFIKISTQPQLIKLDCSIFFLHTILILNFMTLPQIMNVLKLLPIEQSKIYCINILIALIVSAITILYAEKTKKMKKTLITAIYVLFLSEIILLYINSNFYFLFFSILLFFIAFNIIEGILPSILNKETPNTHKGTINGFYATSQFLGTTCGGILGGYLLNIYDIQIIFSLEIIVTMIWLIIIYSLKEPTHTKLN